MVWDAAEQKVTYRLDGREVTLWVDRQTALVGGVAEDLDVPPTLIRDRVLVPLRFVSTNLGADIRFDPADASIRITYPGTGTR